MSLGRLFKSKKNNLFLMILLVELFLSYLFYIEIKAEIDKSIDFVYYLLSFI